MKTSISATLITLICALAITAIDAYSQPAVRAGYETKPFVGSALFRKNFKGHDARNIMPTLVVSSLIVEKQCGEFEKRADCQKRLDTLFDVKLGPMLSVRDRMAFVVEPNCKYLVEPEYFRCGSDILGDLTWEHRLLRQSRYLGQTVFGVKFWVSRSEWENITVKPTKRIQDFEIKDIDPDKASKIKDSIKMVLIGTIAEPFAAYKKAEYPASLDSPNETVGHNYALMLDVEEVVIINQASGEILLSKEIAD